MRRRQALRRTASYCIRGLSRNRVPRLAPFGLAPFAMAALLAFPGDLLAADAVAAEPGTHGADEQVPELGGGGDKGAPGLPDGSAERGADGNDVDGSKDGSSGTGAAGPTSFDLEMMKARGIDPRIAEYFMEGARFTPGMSLVTLTVNGQRKGSVMARFDDQGHLCIDRRFMARAGLRLPGDEVRNGRRGGQAATLAPEVAESEAPKKAEVGCMDFRHAWPATVMTLKPNSSAVDLLVPTDALAPDGPEQTDYATGGVAALLNYDLLATGSQAGGSSTRYFSAANELGFNAGDWIVRNRNMYSNDGNTSNFSHLYAYAQRTFMQQEAVFQGGEINVSNSIFPGPAVFGAQWMPEMALKRSTGSGTNIEGIAQTQARIEVRQTGALIYTTMVPPGPFTLGNVPLLNGSSDVEVTVIEATGAQRRFVVPAAQLNAGTLGVMPGYSLAVGKLRQLGADVLVKPWMATATATWNPLPDAGLTGGVMVGTQYQGLGLGVDARVFGHTNLSARGLFSNAAREGHRGGQLTGSVSTSLGKGFSLNGSATQQSSGYRSLTDTTQDTTTDWINNHYRGQYGAGMSWSQQTLGGFSLNYSRSNLFSGQVTQRLTGSWGKTFKYATVSLSVEKALGGSSSGSSGNGNSVYLSVSVPFGKRSVRGYVNRVDGKTRLGATYNETVNDIFNYSLNAEGRPSEGTAAGSATASVTPYYTRLNVGVSQYGPDSTSYNGNLSGGVVAHKRGVTFSPYAIGDTFGIASLGDVARIRIATSQGPVWTDAWGRAVISSAPAYSSSRIEVTTKSLPRNVDVSNAYRQITPGRGSVSYVDFDIVKVRRILLRAVDAEGKPLPRNATVTDAEGGFLTTVLNDGAIFLPNAEASAALQVVDLEGRTCVLDFTLPMTQDLDAYFDVASAVCKPKQDNGAEAIRK